MWRLLPLSLRARVAPVFGCPAAWRHRARARAVCARLRPRWDLAADLRDAAAEPRRAGTRVGARSSGLQEQGGFHDTDRARDGLGDRFRRHGPAVPGRPLQHLGRTPPDLPDPHTDRRKSSWMPLRYEDVTAIAHDIEHFSSLKVAVIPGDEDEDPTPTSTGPTSSTGCRRSRRTRRCTPGPAGSCCPGSRTSGSTATCR